MAAAKLLFGYVNHRRRLQRLLLNDLYFLLTTHFSKDASLMMFIGNKIILILIDFCLKNSRGTLRFERVARLEDEIFTYSHRAIITISFTLDLI